MSRGWFVVFAKAPRPGLVKTRLSPPLSADESAELYEGMLGDVLEASGRFALELDLEPVMAFYPAGSANELIHLAPSGFRLQLQRGVGLAERMANAFAEGAAAGARWVLLRGSDSPALGLEHVAAAASALESGSDLVVTPDRGGGYAMLGLREPCPELFEIPMSTPNVLGLTLEAAARSGLHCVETPSTFDINVAKDLARLDSLTQREVSDLCPRTVESVAALRATGML